MNGFNRRSAIQAAFAAAAAAALPAVFGQAAAEPRVIEMTARRYTYEPNEIAVKAGERVVLAIRSIDFVHGLNIPDLGLRFDLMPGRVTRVELQPPAPGVIDFLCDNFCGEGHESMHGRLVVSA